MSLTEAHQKLLLALAKRSIEHGLRSGRPLAVKVDDYPQELTEPRATFVTLTIDGQLRGCIGMLEAIRPLVRDIAENAFAAAFKDPRFPPLAATELQQLTIHLSILSPSQAMQFTSEADLIKQLRPGIDGLIFAEGSRRATFLPSVWETLPEPIDFLRHLKQKAGFPAGYWSDTLKFYRYRTDYID
ncbi:MAG: AmmeMemoRadiSam system protein A [Gammaproteobacteria bacterium]